MIRRLAWVQHVLLGVLVAIGVWRSLATGAAAVGVLAATGVLLCRGRAPGSLRVAGLATQHL